MTEQYEAASLPEWMYRRERRRERRRKIAAAIIWPFKTAYYRFVYRAHMKLLHRHGRHSWRLRGHIMSPPLPHWYCNWCGAIEPLDDGQTEVNK